MKTRLALTLPLVLVAVPLLSALPAFADTILVTPSQALEVRFTVPHPLKTFTDRGGVTINGPIGLHSAYLYDGDTLLGVVTNNLVGSSFVEIGTFMSPGSLFYAGPDRQSVIDLTSILDGTIDGRLVFTISSGSLKIDDTTHITAQLGLGYYGTFGQGDDVNDLSMDSVPTVVPEPASLLLFGTGLVGLRAWRKRRQ